MNSRWIPKICLVLLLFSACQAQQSTSQTGILKGITGIFTGNCMPSIGSPPCKPAPISTTVLITKPSEKFSMELLIDSIVSNNNGEYQISLQAGQYSLFLRDGNEIVCREFRCDNQCICYPFTILKDSTTIINPNLDHANW